MKIAIISNLFPPFVRGGAERIAALEAQALRALGHDVFVITAGPARLGAKRYTFERTSWEGVPVFRFHPANLYFTLDDYKQPVLTRVLWHIMDAMNYYAASVVRRILRTEAPDLVITHNLKGLSLLIPRAIRALRIPHVHTLHDVQLLEPSGLLYTHEEPALRLLVRRIAAVVTRKLFGSPTLVVSPTEWLLLLHRAHGFFPGSRMGRIENPSVPAQVASVVRSSELRFVFLGQLEKHKGILDLLRAFEEASKDERLEASLDVIGDGSELPRVKEFIGIRKHIRLHGRLPHEKVLSVLRGATALVAPSRCLENAPGVLFEAFSCGVPVLATEVGGIPEFVKENQTGWLVPPGDIAALSRMLRHIAFHPKEVQMLSSRIKERVQMTPERYVTELLSMLPKS